MPKKKWGRKRHPAPNLSAFEAHYKPSSIRQHLGPTNLFGDATIARWKWEAGHSNRQPVGRLSHPTPNGPNDPLSIMLVLDCIMRLETDNYVQAGGLVTHLIHYSQIVWDPVTVGKILNGLHELSVEAAPDKTNIPIDRGSFGGATMYAVSQDTEAWKYLGALREAIGSIARHTIREERESNTLAERTPTVWDDLGQVAWTDRA